MAMTSVTGECLTEGGVHEAWHDALTTYGSLSEFFEKTAVSIDERSRLKCPEVLSVVLVGLALRDRYEDIWLLYTPGDETFCDRVTHLTQVCIRNTKEGVLATPHTIHSLNAGDDTKTLRGVGMDEKTLVLFLVPRDHVPVDMINHHAHFVREVLIPSMEMKSSPTAYTVYRASRIDALRSFKWTGEELVDAVKK